MDTLIQLPGKCIINQAVIIDKSYRHSVIGGGALTHIKHYVANIYNLVFAQRHAAIYDYELFVVNMPRFNLA